MNYVTLNNGVRMPQLGVGGWQVPDEQAPEAVAKAVEVGYRSIDTFAERSKNLHFLVKNYLLQPKYGIVTKAMKILYVPLMRA